MIPWQELLAIAVILFLVLAIRSSLRKSRDRKQREKLRKLELVLQPRETIKVICPQKGGRCILTSKRLLFETKKGFNAVVLKDIKRVQGTNEAGNRTTSIPKMVSLTVKAEKDYVILNSGEAFADLAKQLTAKVKKQNEKKAEKEKKEKNSSLLTPNS